MKLKKVYYFLIITYEVDVCDEVDPWSDHTSYTLDGTQCVQHSRYYDTIEDAYPERSNYIDRHYWCSPIMEGWIDESEVEHKN